MDGFVAVEGPLTPNDPTAGPGWSHVDVLGDQIVDDPLTREAGSRGVEPWEITPGAPPVRGAQPKRGRTLLRDATLHRNILKKARTTPTPAPVARRREAETARKPDGNEREFFKPAAPLLTNVLVDRPPPVRKAADPTWDPAPERVVSAPPLEVDAAPEADMDLEQAWFLSADGTLEPAEERASLPPRRIAVFLAAGAAIGAIALAAVAIGRGDAGSSAEAVTSIAAVVTDVETVHEVAPAPVVEVAAVEAEGVADEAPVVVEPVVVAAAPAPVAAKPAPVRAEPVATASAPGSAMDRLRASMADNPMLESKAAVEPVPEPVRAAEPVKIPEGSAELWGQIEESEASAASPWTELK